MIQDLTHQSPFVISLGTTFCIVFEGIAKLIPVKIPFLLQKIKDFKPTTLPSMFRILNLMESGILSELKHKQQRTTQLKKWVFSSGNSVDKILLPPPYLQDLQLFISSRIHKKSLLKLLLRS
jgi:long-subunit acyl-CoA synthetase (AMP-forming)